ncbi:MAG: SDR family oxidoreductase [Clostridiales bacterium]|nr:SDR family oxidoreductase [Clostridiales bacterium]
MKNIIIIGGSRGIGLAAARELVAAGHRVFLVGRSEDHLREALSGLPAGTETAAIDMAQTDAPEKLLACLKERDWTPDGLVFSAAAFGNRNNGRSVIEPGRSDLEQILVSNVVAPYATVKTLLPALRERHGQIVLIGSTAGIRRDKGGIYGISKWAFAFSLSGQAVLEQIDLRPIEGDTY